MQATIEQKLAGETKRFEAQGYDKAEASRLARELLGLDLREKLLSKPMRSRNYRELYESELRRANCLLARVVRLNRANQELKARLALLESEAKTT